ncbi:MAG TPA: hypothetical protein PKK06_12765 [Phycisphaerae bacterium]|nr:hypothetical protein [Phycisphaerae bacterium]HNU45508.1 hypothetical protein [Phycisphaerae bacterium]
MSCKVSKEQLWSWIDRDAPELEEHLATCPQCRAKAAEIRAGIETVESAPEPATVPLSEKIGPYVIQRLLGKGGQPRVHPEDLQLEVDFGKLRSLGAR